MKIEAKKINKFLSKAPEAIARHPFCACCLLFLLSILIGAILFYKYDFLAQKTPPLITGKKVLLNEEAYNNVLMIWGEQEERFEEVDFKTYSSPFKKRLTE